MATQPITPDEDQKLPLAAGRGEEATASAPDKKRDVTDEEVKIHVVDLVKTLERESDNVRRHHVRRWLKSEEFWKANHYLIWSERNSRYFTPFEKSPEGAKDDQQPRYQYVVNLYRSYGLKMIAAISRRLPDVKFSPVSAKSERDIATADAASDVQEVVERNNDIDKLAVRCGYLLWTQGLICGYVRYVVDEEFGTHDEPTMEMQTSEIAPDRYLCPGCASETPADQVEGDGFVPGQKSCPDCGSGMDDTHFRPQEVGELPVVTGQVEYPNGQEVVSLYGPLQVKLQPTAETLRDSLYLILCEERHEATLKAAYPLKAEKIGAPGTGSSSEDSLERMGRLSLVDAPPYQRSAQTLPKMVTYKKAWLRPQAFWAIDDKDVREKLQAEFPSGVRVDLSDSECLALVPEKLDKKWRICRPMPGQGMYVSGAGDDTISINEQFNDAQNVKAEHVEFGSAPPVLVDARYIKMDALKNRRMQPASFFPVNPEGANAQTKLSDMTHQMEYKIDAGIYSHGKDLVELFQVVSNILPSVFGGSMQNVDTYGGYKLASDQSLGTLLLFWRAVRQFWAQMALISVECFAENRSDDYEKVVTDKSGDYISEYIHLEDLQGNITAHPDVDEDFPATPAEMRQNIMDLMEKAPDEIKALLMHPSNAPFVKKLLANPQLVIPGEDDRQKQYREIDQLLRSQPVEIAPGQFQSAVLPDVFVDDHDAHILTMQEFLVSDKGLEQKKMDPMAYANCVAHITDHIKAKAQKEQFIAMLSAPPPQLPPGGEQPGDAAGAPQPGGDQPQGDQGGQTLGDKIEQAVPGAGEAAEKLLSSKVQ